MVVKKTNCFIWGSDILKNMIWIPEKAEKSRMG
jgi:hypothetical protein